MMRFLVSQSRAVPAALQSQLAELPPQT
jgi:hypothetical protein